MSTTPEYYPVEVAGVKRELRLFEIKPGVRIAILNILGDTAFVRAAANALSTALKGRDFELLVTAEAKAIPLAQALGEALQMNYIVLRKSYKPYMGDALRSETLSITTGEPQTLYLDEKDRSLIRGRKVCVLDDVISTGSTLQGMRLILDKAGAKITTEAAIFTEGDRALWHDIVALGHLPVFVDEAGSESKPIT